MNLEKIINGKRGTIVDVRSSMEFSGGNAAGAVNIPLPQIQEHLEELKQLQTPLILCCASGNRSAIACEYLSLQGLDCLNGGSWRTIQMYQSKTQYICSTH